MRLWKWLLIAQLLLCVSACVWKPVSFDEETRKSVDSAVEQFQTEEALNRFFDEAVAYVVFPTSVRAGSGFGGAYGSGWLFEGGGVSGRTTMFEFFAGPNLGAQAYRSILFFRTDESLEKFKRGRFEFTGQANAAVVTVGAGATPSFSQDVAMFTQVRGGLLLEASVGAQRYDYFPIVEGTNE